MNLKEARFRAGKTQWDLAVATQINQTKISLLERGYIVPNFTEKQALAAVLGVAVDDLQFETTAQARES